MGANSSSTRFKSRSTNDVNHIRPSAEQRSAPRHRSRLSMLASASTKKLSKLSFKRKSQTRDKIRVFRDLISTWPSDDVEALFREMDAMRQLHELFEEATSARPCVSSVGEQLIASSAHSMELVFKSVKVPVHRRFLCARSSKIAEMTTEQTAVLELTSPLGFLDEDEFREFIRFLYTENCSLEKSIITRLRDDFDVTRSLTEDLKILEQQSSVKGDFTLVLRSSAPERKFPDFEIVIDSDILASRSDLLGSLVRRQQDNRIVLDEDLLPRVLAPVVVHFLYTDELSLDLISPTTASISSLSEVRAMVNGQSTDSPVHQASQIVHVAKFFGLLKLVQLSEDVIVNALNVENCASILAWAEDGGSRFVANNARAFLINEFSKIISTHHLFSLTIEQLEDVLRSHFAQAAEVEILDAIIRWGEHELLRRMESREPNLIAETSHSISRRGIRRSEESEKELKTILQPLSAHIRTDYILPFFNQSLNTAYSRGLIERSPLKDLVVCSSTSEINPDLHWFCPDPHATGPRFYRPYFEALKAHIAHSASPSATMRSSGSATTAPLKVIIVNALPGVLSDETFAAVRERILALVDEADAKYALRFMPRPFHRRMAVELIATRILREFEVDAESIEVRLAEWNDSQGSTSTSSSVRLHLHNSQPALHWPDIMTLERRQKVMSNNARSASAEVL